MPCSGSRLFLIVVCPRRIGSATPVIAPSEVYHPIRMLREDFFSFSFSSRFFSLPLLYILFTGSSTTLTPTPKYIQNTSKTPSKFRVPTPRNPSTKKKKFNYYQNHYYINPSAPHAGQTNSRSIPPKKNTHKKTRRANGGQVFLTENF